MDRMLKVALLTGGGEKHYQIGLTKGLVNAGIEVEVVGNDEMAKSDIINMRGVTFYNLRGDQNPNTTLLLKIFRVLKYYYQLISFAFHSKAIVFHIQWDNKFRLIDRLLLMVYYKMLGKKVVYTVHNINVADRDGNNSWFNEFSLKIQYTLSNHLIVHTVTMKEEMIRKFHINDKKISVISHGINSIVPQNRISRERAREKLHLSHSNKVLLFFGNIERYKGVDILINAFEQLKNEDEDFFLVIAGKPKGTMKYLNELKEIIRDKKLTEKIFTHFEFVPDDEIENYFIAADCTVLPYRTIYQSGILFLAYTYGTPILASKVGNFANDIIENKTGYVFEPENMVSMNNCIRRFFSSEMYQQIGSTRQYIMNYANEKYSWNTIGQETRRIYESLT